MVGFLCENGGRSYKKLKIEILYDVMSCFLRKFWEIELGF